MNRLLLALFLALLAPTSSFSYTHLTDNNADGKPSVSFWPTNKNTLTFTIDKEPTTVEGVSPQDIAEKAIKLWNNVSGSTVELKLVKSSEDIHSVNFKTKVKVGDNKLDIVVEQDGNLLETLGLDGQFVAGIGVPITSNNPSGNIKEPIYGTIIDAFVIVNTEQGFTQERLLRLLTHELGHTLGLGHTNVAHLSDKSKLPVMFYDPLQTKGTVELHLDDVAALATLYPDSSFETRFGALSGKVLNREGQPTFGVAVIATPTDKETEPIGVWTKQDGSFHLSGLPVGSYKIQVRPLDGSQQVNDMNATIHVGGIYNKSTTEFCAEAYNDRVFAFCRTIPFFQDSVPIQPGQTIELGAIQEGRENPSPAPTCVFGSLPQLPNRGITLPGQVPSQGQRGETCPPPALEKPPEQSNQEPASQEKIIVSTDSSFESRIDTSLPVPVCGCESTETPVWMGFFCLLVLVFFRTQRTSQP